VSRIDILFAFVRLPACHRVARRKRERSDRASLPR